MSDNNGNDNNGNSNNENGSGGDNAADVKNSAEEKSGQHKRDLSVPEKERPPVLCVLPEDGHVCVRCFFRNQTMLRELADPERKQVSFAAFDPDRIGVVGPVISVQRFIRSWRRYGGPETPEAEA